MKKRFSFRLLVFMCMCFFCIHISAQTNVSFARYANDTLRLTGSFISVQWEVSSDGEAWYSIPGATNPTYVYTVVAPAYFRAKQTDAANNVTYSAVQKVVFQSKSFLKIIKSSGGQGYAETNGQPVSGINIQEDRGSDGNLNLTAYSDGWTNPNASLAWYLYHTIGDYDIDIVLNITKDSIQKFEYSIIDINNTGLKPVKSIISVVGKGENDTITALTIKIPVKGFYKYELKPITNPNNTVKVVGFLFKSLNSANADVHATNYCSSPSVHLTYWRSTDPTVKSGQKYDWCYEEILVPPGGDPVSTYYMSLGVLGGYMGIQTGTNERGVIFSMWDDGDTDKDPTLDRYRRAGAVDHDPATAISRFGNEGTGTKSYVHGLNWRTGVPVKFITNARLEEYDDTLKNIHGDDSIVHRQNTLVSAWFNSDPVVGWRYISTLRLPNKVKYFDSWYSFLEDFGSANGQLRRFAYYYNGFAHEQSSDPSNPGRWISFNKVNFGNTDGGEGQRVDFEQGKAPDKSDAFYMSSGGYANAPKKYESQIPLQTDKSVVESLDLSKFLQRVDKAVANEKHRNDSIRKIMNGLADKTGWTIEDFSSEETSGEGPINGRASTVIDGDNATYWHSAWWSGQAAFPHYIAVDMRKMEKVTGFLFQLSGGTSRHMKGIELWGSADGTTYQLMFKQDVPDLEQLYVPLSKAWEISKFKLVINTSQTGEVHCRINEIGVTVEKVTGIIPLYVPKKGQTPVYVFPNPAQRELNFSLNVNVANAKVFILSMSGKSLFSRNIGNIQPFQVNKLMIPPLAKGFYLLQIKNNRKTIGTQIICLQNNK